MTRKFRYLALTLVFASISSLTFGQNVTSDSYAILFDNSRSLEPERGLQNRIAHAVLRRTEQGRISFFGFSSAPDTDTSPYTRFAAGIECTNDVSAVRKIIDEVGTAYGQTTLFDGIKSAIERMNREDAAGCSKAENKVLVIISDGEDRYSEVTAKQLFEFTKTSGVKVYAIGLIANLPGPSPYFSSNSKKRATDFLTTLAKNSGGRVVFVQEKESGEEAVGRLFSSGYKHPK